MKYLLTIILVSLLCISCKNDDFNIKTTVYSAVYSANCMPQDELDLFLRCTVEISCTIENKSHYHPNDIKICFAEALTKVKSFCINGFSLRSVRKLPWSFIYDFSCPSVPLADKEPPRTPV